LKAAQGGGRGSTSGPAAANCGQCATSTERVTSFQRAVGDVGDDSGEGLARLAARSSTGSSSEDTTGGGSAGARPTSALAGAGSASGSGAAPSKAAWKNSRRASRNLAHWAQELRGA